jgi:hypothetical protein
MVVDFNMLSPSMINRVRSKSKSPNIITPNRVEYAMSNQKFFKLVRYLFTTTITLKLFDGRRELIFHKRLKLDKKLKHI